MEYQPSPLDTKAVAVPQAVLDAWEQIAQNTHEVWAQNKLASGWHYGTEYDSFAKTHPDLVPYEFLSDAKKNYDRCTAMEVIRVLLLMGFQIKEPD